VVGMRRGRGCYISGFCAALRRAGFAVAGLRPVAGDTCTRADALWSRARPFMLARATIFCQMGGYLHAAATVDTRPK